MLVKMCVVRISIDIHLNAAKESPGGYGLGNLNMRLLKHKQLILIRDQYCLRTQSLRTYTETIKVL